jgi:glycerol dehydrogenase-like iron-containing ADH family enzyme
LSKNHDMSHGAQVGQNTVMPLVVEGKLDMQKITQFVLPPMMHSECWTWELPRQSSVQIMWHA